MGCTTSTSRPPQPLYPASPRMYPAEYAAPPPPPLPPTAPPPMASGLSQISLDAGTGAIKDSLSDRFYRQLRAAKQYIKTAGVHVLFAVDLTSSNEHYEGAQVNRSGGQTDGLYSRVANTGHYVNLHRLGAAAPMRARDGDPDPPIPPASSLEQIGRLTTIARAHPETLFAAAQRAEDKIGNLYPRDLNDYLRTMCLLHTGLSETLGIENITLVTFGARREASRCTVRSNGSFDMALQAYCAAVQNPRDDFGNTTDFSDVIEEATKISQQSQRTLFVFILTDGQLSPNRKMDTVDAFVRATNLPILFTIVGIGKGDFGDMNRLDDGVEGKRFDNIQFVSFNTIAQVPSEYAENPSVYLMEKALNEVPQALAKMNQLGLLWEQRIPPPPPPPVTFANW